MTFRSKLLMHPHQLDDEMLTFLEQNPDKKTLVQKTREFDQHISDALDVDVPEGLHARILLKQSYQQQAESVADSKNNNEMGTTDELEIIEDNNVVKGPWFTHLFRLTGLGSIGALGQLGRLGGIAASLLGFAILFSVWQNPNAPHAISGEDTINHILAHIQEDPTLMTAVKLPKTNQELNQLFASVGAQLNKPVEGMSYAGICDVEGQQGLHIVLQDSGNPVTVIVMPGQKLAAMEAFQKSGYHGEMIPVKGGVVAIVGNTMDQVLLAQARFFKAVRFV